MPGILINVILDIDYWCDISECQARLKEHKCVSMRFEVGIKVAICVKFIGDRKKTCYVLVPMLILDIAGNHFLVLFYYIRLWVI